MANVEKYQDKSRIYLEEGECQENVYKEANNQNYHEIPRKWQRKILRKYLSFNVHDIKNGILVVTKYQEISDKISRKCHRNLWIRFSYWIALFSAWFLLWFQRLENSSYTQTQNNQNLNFERILFYIGLPFVKNRYW